MTRLREALDGIAEEAPLVDLLDVVVAGHRRRRRISLALTAVATAAAVGAAFTAVSLPWRWSAAPAVPQQQANAVPDLPGGKVGPLSYAYRTRCEVVAEPIGVDCDSVEWRVVTTAGKTYRLPQALAHKENGHDVPVALSRDGRKLAYYSREAQAHVVRDLITGAEVSAPTPEEKIGIGSMLVVSDDGRYLVFDPREGSKYPGVLIDTSTGRRTTINGRYEPIAIKDGVVELIRYIKTDLWFMPVTGGGKPVRFDGTFISPSELAPDQRTVVAFDHGKYSRSAKPVLTVLDVRTGRAVREITVTGLSAASGYLTPTIWRDATEVEVRFHGNRGWELYALNVTTGKARLLKRYDTKLSNLTLPGEAAGTGL
ncbi:hypothetical protein HCN51_50395 [Nonomuraea sp. FMUSA5-5]|uniref:WD40 repeat domain-containing protein n=1 Tax=Nonomuraea composti TaxID=2720023 RepID=A0ABX1BQS4_9ACTN|nr:hypothetical protein [Nonomuraea sp. FMUSA5-5]NJP97548.1 hypothetical protein [Nonomuraea sp. FMUSA5-5]